MQSNFPKEVKKVEKTTTANFICGINNISVDDDLGDGVLLIPGKQNSDFPQIYLTNNRKKIASLPLSSSDFRTSIGEIEFDHLQNAYPIVAYSRSTFNRDEMSSLNYLDFHLYLLKTYFFSLWLVKDNAADFDIAFIEDNYKNNYSVSSNTMTNTDFTCLGIREETKFSSKELEDAAEYLSNNIQIKHKQSSALVSSPETGKITLANYFVSSARIASDLGIKIVNYCSMFETLFSGSETSELTHRLSERIAKFLRTDLNDRIQIYQTIKKIYDLRSRVGHGSISKIKAEELNSLLINADNISREIMAYALSTEGGNIFNLSQEEHANYFLNLILN